MTFTLDVPTHLHQPASQTNQSQNTGGSLHSLEAGLDVEAIRARRLKNNFLVELEEFVVCLVVAEFVDGNRLCYCGVSDVAGGRGVCTKMIRALNVNIRELCRVSANNQYLFLLGVV